MLTDTAIKAAKPRGKKYALTDGNGLVLWVQPDFKKVWRFHYRYQGKANMLSLGSYPARTLKQVRTKVAAFKDLLASGVDPSQHRKEEKQNRAMANANTFQAIALDWFQQWKTNKTDRHSNVILSNKPNNRFGDFGVKCSLPV
jgi:hypothetical protein